MFRLPVRDGVELRVLKDEHAEELFRLVDANRAMLREWLPWVDASLSPDDTRQFIQAEWQKYAANRGLTSGLWVGGDLAGVVGVHEPSWLNRRVSLGYWLAAPFQGRGLITDAVRETVTLLFREWKLHRVEIHVAVGNHRSAAIPRRLGFREEAVLRDALFVNGRYHDMRLFAALEQEWMA